MRKADASFIPVAGSNEKELLAWNMAGATAMWWYKFWSLKYTQVTVESLTDSFEMDDHLSTSAETFDSSTMVVELDFTA